MEKVRMFTEWVCVFLAVLFVFVGLSFFFEMKLSAACAWAFAYSVVAYGMWYIIANLCWSLVSDDDPPERMEFVSFFVTLFLPLLLAIGLLLILFVALPIWWMWKKFFSPETGRIAGI